MPSLRLRGWCDDRRDRSVRRVGMYRTDAVHIELTLPESGFPHPSVAAADIWHGAARMAGPGHRWDLNEVHQRWPGERPEAVEPGKA